MKIIFKGFIGLILSTCIVIFITEYSTYMYLGVLIIIAAFIIGYIYIIKLFSIYEDRIKNFLRPYYKLIPNILIPCLILLSICLALHHGEKDTISTDFQYYLILILRIIGFFGFIYFSWFLFKVVIPINKEKDTIKKNLSKIDISDELSINVDSGFIKDLKLEKLNDLSLNRKSRLPQILLKREVSYIVPNIFCYQKIHKRGVENNFFKCNSYKTLIKMKYGMPFSKSDYFDWIYKSTNNDRDKGNPTVTDFMIFMMYLADQIGEQKHQLRINLIKDKVKIGNRILRDKKDTEKIDENQECYIYSKFGSDALENIDNSITSAKSIKDLFEVIKT